MDEVGDLALSPEVMQAGIVLQAVLYPLIQVGDGKYHAFTPWTGIYAYYRSLAECYQEKTARIAFIELGLSADTDYADRIAELSSRTFLSNSDAHSPLSNKLAREFNRMEIEALGFREIAMAITREKGRHPTLNVGFFPEEGKYNRTACTRCYQQYSAVQMEELMGRCPECQGQIKLGCCRPGESSGRLCRARAPGSQAALFASHPPGRDHSTGSRP